MVRLLVAVVLCAGVSWAAAPASAPASEDARPRLTVLELSSTQGLDPEVAKSLTHAITMEAHAIGTFQVSSAAELQAALGLERQRQILGCAEGSSACTMELAQALGARFALSGSLAKLGETYQLNLSMLDTRQGAPVGRSTRLARSLEEIRGQIPWALAEATGTPPPRAASHALPYGLMIGGGVSLVASGVLFLQSVVREQSVLAELNAMGATLRSPASFEQDAAQIVQFRIIGAIAAGVGAVAFATGLILNPSADATVRVSLVPTPFGGALVGGFP